MRTIYPAAGSEPELLPEPNILDLEAYRRQHQPAPAVPAQDSAGAEELNAWDRYFANLSQGERRAWTLDACASLGVVIMTLAFVLRVLFP